MDKYFKSNTAYLKYINKLKDKIKIISVTFTNSGKVKLTFERTK